MKSTMDLIKMEIYSAKIGGGCKVIYYSVTQMNLGISIEFAELDS